MFTGIIEDLAYVEKLETSGSNIQFNLSCPFIGELKVDQSLAHDGCCLTIVEVCEHWYTVTAIDETLRKTNLKHWHVGSSVNLERCIPISGRIDGHIVQGHVDQVGTLLSIENKNGSFILEFSHEDHEDFITVPQGSIAVNGISLTVAKSEKGRFHVAIIPYTWEYTNLKQLQIGALVNLEFDIIGKYVKRMMLKTTL